MPSDRRLFIVSNRLPVTISGDRDQPQIRPAAGGLVSAIGSYLAGAPVEFSEIYWTGVPGCTPSVWQEASAHLPESEFTYLPVPVYKEQYDRYYNGFSNSMLWPLFHYFPSYMEYHAAEFSDYLQVNEHFADVLERHCREGDVVWIHDYHLLPLAAQLRQRLPAITIGFFLHIPFPSFELFRILPQHAQEALLRGMLGADLIGFHTLDYAQHFLQSVQSVLGLSHERNLLRHNDRLVKVDVFPISIDAARFADTARQPDVLANCAMIREKMKGCRILFSVDRLDYTKGVHNRLKAFELLLRDHPELQGKVVFYMTVVPSRDSIPRYAERKRMIEELIGRINGAFGSLHWQPVLYRYQTLGFGEMVSLYAAADVAVVTPLRDGMNLVAKEFVASRPDGRGVLLLSELAGAARELTGAVFVNPHDIEELASRIYEALILPEEEQERRLLLMQRRIRSYDVRAWAADFMHCLEHVKQRQLHFRERFLDDYARVGLLDRFRQAHKRLLLLDYDGTLVPFQEHPDQAVPGEELRALLQGLGTLPGTDVVVISGRRSSWLEEQFANLPIHLVAEHGARMHWYGTRWITQVQTHSEWKGMVMAVMESFERRCAGSFIEEKEFSLVWHYRNAEPEQGRIRALELEGELRTMVMGKGLEVMPGNKIIEVRNRGIDKGTAIRKILEGKEYDFIFAAGDDRTDEDMFRTLVHLPQSFTIKVGAHASYAHYNLLKPQMLVNLLGRMRCTLGLDSEVHTA